MSKRKKWILGAVLATGVIMAVLVWVASRNAHRLDPFIRQEVLLYLQNRFESDVEIQDLQIQMPKFSALRLYWTHRKGIIAGVDATGVQLRLKGRRDVPPIFIMKAFHFDVDLAGLFEPTKVVQNVTIDGMEINIPPKGDHDEPKVKDVDPDSWKKNVVIEEVIITNSRLTILPKNQKKKPLKFELHRLRLESAGQSVAMKYTASLTNAVPPGEILTKGHFGPWAETEPGDSPLDGEYDFDKADLGVFKSIAGILHSKGSFQGTLDSLDVSGEATIPDFRLKRAGNALKLFTRFQVLVDGTNGDTILKPVVGTLGTTTFTTSGAIIKNDSANKRNISLDVDMPNGNLRDVLLLAMKGPPFMEGRLNLKTRIDIPPLDEKVREKLMLDGMFEITQGRFLKSAIQDQIDSLSRRSQGQPKNESIDEVVSHMGGKFVLDDEIIHFDPVSFAVPGSGIDLSGSVDLDKDILDFQGTLKMQAKVSQTMTGWKHWLLKPVDPFFSKQGFGTLLNIQVQGSVENPKFGMNHHKDPKDEKDNNDGKDKKKKKEEKAEKSQKDNKEHDINKGDKTGTKDKAEKQDH